MIFIALLIYTIGYFVPSWITKKSIKELRAENTWKQAFFELSGLITCFVISFVVILILTFSTKEEFLLNKDAIYGIECNDLCKSWGFQDGDKILKINEKKIVRFSDITITMINSPDSTNVEVERNDLPMVLSLNDHDILTDIMNNGTSDPIFSPRYFEKLTLTKKTKSFNDVSYLYKSHFKLIDQFFPFGTSDYKGKGGFLTVKETGDIRVYLYYLSFSLFLLGYISLLPLPGFGLGNSVLVIAQKVRKKTLNQRKLKILRIIFQSIFIGILLILFIQIYFQ
jgi:membrane-associated protease RseP (regulator of RpoE activity)